MASKPMVVASGFAFLEGPRWHDGRLFVSDMHAGKVIALDTSGKQETILDLGDDRQPSGLGWLPNGSLLVVSMVDRKLLRHDRGGTTVVADLGDIATYHTNDMVVDALGRAYVGNFGWDFESGEKPVPAKLALVLPDGTTSVVAEDLLFPNGTVITPDGKTLIVGESFGARLTAFDVAADGTLSNRRVFAQLDGQIPDGICLDAENAIWLASPLSNEVVRVREGGEITDRIPCDQAAIACMLGGQDRRTLYMLTSPSTNREECRQKRGARVESVRVDVPGAGFP
jgi:sugar lactone lactonase YvrE